MTFDSKCYDLASTFLEDEPNLFTDSACMLLAARIQQAVEDFIAEARDNFERRDHPEGFEDGFFEDWADDDDDGMGYDESEGW